MVLFWNNVKGVIIFWVSMFLFFMEVFFLVLYGRSVVIFVFQYMGGCLERLFFFKLLKRVLINSVVKDKGVSGYLQV